MKVSLGGENMKKNIIIIAVCVAIIGLCGFNFSVSVGDIGFSLKINSIFNIDEK